MTSIATTDLIQLVNSEATHLRGFLAGLNEQAWNQDSACAGWKVSDVAAHLTMAAETWADSITRGAAGDSNPPEGQSFFTAGERGSEIISQAAISYHERVGAELLQNYSAGYDRLAQVMSVVRAEDWDKHCFHRRGPMPMRDYVALRVQELTVHSWDIRSSQDKDAELSREPLSLLAGMVPRWLKNAFRPGLDLAAPARFRFDVSGPAPVHEDVVVKGDSFLTEPAGDTGADVEFRCDTGNYILFIYGRVTVDAATAAGRMTVQGNQEQAAHFSEWFRGF